MKKYVAFLRGINISGKNKISMANLKTEFETLGYFDVSTYLNSGNIVFSTSEGSINAIENNIENMMADKFGFTIPVYVILINDLSDILLNAPDWWGTDDKDKLTIRTANTISKIISKEK